MEEDIESWGWSEYFIELQRFFTDLEIQYGIARSSYCDYANVRLEVCEVTLNRLLRAFDERDDLAQGMALNGLREKLVELRGLVRSLHFQWQQYAATVDHRSEQASYHAVATRSGGRGRPTFFVSEQQIVYLRSLAFTWVEIASLLGISRMTLYRRREEYGLIQDPRTIPTNAELMQLVQELRRELPYCGEVLLLGRLRSMGYLVTRSRLRDVIHNIDPISTALRWRGDMHARRPYSVPGPNSLWHIGKYSSYIIIIMLQ